MKNKKTFILMFFIIALGFFLRIYNIENAPPGIYPDEAVNGLDAVRAIDAGKFEWFYPDNNGREGLFMNLIALAFKLFGVSVLTLKLPAIIFGTLTIWGTYLLAKELFSSYRIGLISAFLVSVSFWAINFSRISFRANMVPALLVFSFYFLFKGLRTRKWYDFAAGGFIFGLGLHTYIAFRIAPLILVVMLATLIITRERFLRKYWSAILLFIVFAAFSAGPMLYTFFYSHPEYWTSRTGNISILNPEINQGHLFTTFLKTFGLSIVKYNFWGDQNWRHNFPPYPLLDPLTSIAFTFGLAYAVLKFFHLLAMRFIKRVRDEKLEVYTFLLIWFLAMLVPEVMGYEGNPHALRAIGTLPVVFIFSALTFNYFIGRDEEKTYAQKKIVTVFILLMLLSVGIFNSVKYHLVWAKKAETAQAFEKNVMDIVRYVDQLPPEKEIFLATGNMQRIPPRFLFWKKENFHDLHPAEISGIRPVDEENFEIIFTDYHKDEIVDYVRSSFPAMRLEEKNDGRGQVFFVFKY